MTMFFFIHCMANTWSSRPALPSISSLPRYRNPREATLWFVSYQCSCSQAWCTCIEWRPPWPAAPWPGSWGHTGPGCRCHCRNYPRRSKSRNDMKNMNRSSTSLTMTGILSILLETGLTTCRYRQSSLWLVFATQTWRKPSQMWCVWQNMFSLWKHDCSLMGTWAASKQVVSLLLRILRDFKRF